MPEIYTFLGAEGSKYTIRLPANPVLQRRICYLLRRPVGRPAKDVRRTCASFRYQAKSWATSRRVLASAEMVEIGGERHAGATGDESGAGALRDEVAIGTVG